MRLEVELPGARRLAVAVDEEHTVDDVRRQCQKKIRRINEQNDARSQEVIVCAPAPAKNDKY